MKERHTRVHTILVELLCENCEGRGNMVKSDRVLLTAPPMYVYECDRCDNVVKTITDYPYTKYVEAIETNKIGG